MTRGHDIAVIGSGFAGSLISMALARLGRRVILLEQGRHPRFAIGESSTPLTNLWLEAYARDYSLPGVAGLCKWGSWQRDHPGVACGLKRGFTFYQHRPGLLFQDDALRRHQLLVAASPHDGIADTHWYRPDFDHHLVRLAVDLGVEYHDQSKVVGFESSREGCRLTVQGGGGSMEVLARHVVDASGPRGSLHRLLALGESPIPGIRPASALFSHFRDVAPLAGLPEFQSPGTPPYPPDAAAVHHVFPGGWIWVLRFNNGITSAGVALQPELAAELRVGEGEAAWGRLLERLPSVARQFEGARPVAPFHVQSPMPFLAARGTGPGWCLLPSALGFVDPLLSTGFALTLLGLHRLTRAIGEHWEDGRLDSACDACLEQSRQELLRVGALVGALYRVMDDFDKFVPLTKLYFAAASYSETMIRLGRIQPADSVFLLGGDPDLGPGLGSCIEEVLRSPSREAEGIVARMIGRIDVAGLCGEGRRNWFPVDAEDLRRSRLKLNATHEEIEALLKRCGFDG